MCAVQSLQYTNLCADVDGVYVDHPTCATQQLCTLYSCHPGHHPLHHIACTHNYNTTITTKTMSECWSTHNMYHLTWPTPVAIASTAASVPHLSTPLQLYFAHLAHLHWHVATHHMKIVNNQTSKSKQKTTTNLQKFSNFFDLQKKKKNTHTKKKVCKTSE